MQKYLVGTLDSGAFGAIVDRRIVIGNLARRFGRVPVFVYNGYHYGEPYTYKYTLEDSGQPTASLSYNEQEEKTVFFDFNYYWNTNTEEFITLKKKRNWVEDGGTLASFDLKPKYQDIVSKTMERFPDISNSISLHIRRGDKIVEGPYIPLQSYIDACVDARERCGSSIVYINSDCDKVIVEAISELEKLDFECFFDEEEKRFGFGDPNEPNNNSNWEMTQNNPETREQEALTPIKIIYTMAKSKYIIGGINVQLPTLASKLHSYYRHISGEQDSNYTLLNIPVMEEL